MTTRQTWIACGVAGWLGGLSLLTTARVHVWRSDLALWTAAVVTTPLKPRPVLNEGRAHELAGDPDFAEAAYRRALSLSFDPRRSPYARRFVQAAAETNLAHLAIKEGRLGAAMHILDRTLDDWPSFPYAHYNRGSILWLVGACAEAHAEYAAAIAIDDTLPPPKGTCAPRSSLP